MRLSTATTALGLALVASGTSARPFWTSKTDDIPALSVQEWQATQSGDFGGLAAASAADQDQDQAGDDDDAFHRIWAGVRHATAAPLAAIDDLEAFIEETLEGYRDAAGLAEAGAASASAWDDDSEKTIWQLLQQDEERYSKIVKLLTLEETGKAIEVLDDRATSITFFAPENSGIPDPHRRGGEHGGDDDADEESLFAALAAEPSATNLLAYHERLVARAHGHGGGGGDDEGDKKRRHEAFQFILRSVLMYHGLPEALSATELASNNTVATALTPKFGANDKQPLRIRIEKKLVPPSLQLNFYATVSSADKKAKNGYIHTINHPLLPPPGILDAAFLFPTRFSTLTSAIQKVHGQEAVEWTIDYQRSKKERKPVFKGNPALTLFAPTNDAFAKLPEKLSLFLFSPFGERVLAKVLAYHVLPHDVLFSESLHHASHGHKGHKEHKGHHGHDHDHEHKHKHHKHDHEHEHERSILGDDPSFHKEVELPSGLEGEKLRIVVDKSRVVPVPGAIKTKVTVNDVEVETYDVPALNGVIHVLPEVLRPPHKHHDDEAGVMVESTWQNWEDWLVDWANTQ